MLGRIRDDLPADDAVLAIDGNVALVAEGWDGEVHRLAAIGRAFALEYLTVQRALVSFCAAFAGLSGQMSRAVLPALMAAFSPSELR